MQWKVEMMLRPVNQPVDAFFMHAMQHAITIHNVHKQRGRDLSRSQIVFGEITG